MPTKGRSRRHESIRLRTAGPTPAAVNGPAAPAAGGDMGPWPEADSEDPGSGGGADGLERRTYRGAAGTRVGIPNATELRRAVRSQRGEPVEFDANILVVDDNDPVGLIQVAGAVAAGHRGGLAYYVVDRGLRCQLHRDEDCEHQRTATEALGAVLEGRRLRTALTDWEESTRAVADELAAAHQRSQAARAQPPAAVPGGPAWSGDPAAFQAAYQAALSSRAAGERAIPYMSENATGGLGARMGGRGFGVELEFDIPASANRRAALAAIGRDLHAAGLTASPGQAGYHASRDYSRWRFEADVTVAGEVISPVLYDEPGAWRQLEQVCAIIRRNGGQATARTGGHVHVGVGDYDHTVEHHNNLLGMFAEHEDVLYRLAQRPGARAHRGQIWCRPNAVPADGYRAIHEVRGRHSGHELGLNFGAVTGQQTDHVEFRMWDGSLDPATIQSHINLSLGLTDAAFRCERGTLWGREPIGLHRQRNREVRRGERLRGERWRADTASFRRLVDRVFARQANREQAAALFASTRWQRPT